MYLASPPYLGLVFRHRPCAQRWMLWNSDRKLAKIRHILPLGHLGNLSISVRIRAHKLSSRAHLALLLLSLASTSFIWDSTSASMAKRSSITSPGSVFLMVVEISARDPSNSAYFALSSCILAFTSLICDLTLFSLARSLALSQTIGRHDLLLTRAIFCLLLRYARMSLHDACGIERKDADPGIKVDTGVAFSVQ